MVITVLLKKTLLRIEELKTLKESHRERTKRRKKKKKWFKIKKGISDQIQNKVNNKESIHWSDALSNEVDIKKSWVSDTYLLNV